MMRMMYLFLVIIIIIIIIIIIMIIILIEDDVPLLGDGLGGEDLVTQLVLLAPLHPGDDHLVDFDQLLLLMAMILNYDDEDDDDNHNEINIFCSGLMRHGG